MHSVVYLNRRSTLYFFKYQLLRSSPPPYTLHPTSYTLHPTPCILYPTPYTLLLLYEPSISGNASDGYLLNYAWTVRCVTFASLLPSYVRYTFDGFNWFHKFQVNSMQMDGLSKKFVPTKKRPEAMCGFGPLCCRYKLMSHNNIDQFPRYVDHLLYRGVADE